MKVQVKNLRGSVTVETALVIPIVFLAVMTVLHVLFLIFQTCALQTAVNSITESLATKSSSGLQEANPSIREIEQLGLYRRWHKLTKSDSIEETVLMQVKRNSIIRSKSIHVDIEQQNNIFSRMIHVQVTASYHNPMGQLTSIWGLGSETTIKVEANATVDDPVEFIRNTDFILDSAAHIPALAEFEQKWQDTITQIINYINKFAKEYR